LSTALKAQCVCPIQATITVLALFSRLRSSQYPEPSCVLALLGDISTLTLNLELACDPIAVNLINGGGSRCHLLRGSATRRQSSCCVCVVHSEYWSWPSWSHCGYESIRGTFTSGSEFPHYSISSGKREAPSVLQFRLAGGMAHYEVIAQQSNISFSNICGVFRVLLIEDSISWDIFVSLSIFKCALGISPDTPRSFVIFSNFEY